MVWFTLLAAALAGDILVDSAGLFWGTTCIAMVSWAVWKSAKINAEGMITQERRNQWLPEKVKEQTEHAVPAPAPGSRELDLKTLRFVQHMIERGLTPHTDLSYHDVIDQFQTGAVRYQLYGVFDSLSLYLIHYAPGFHGYAAEACRNYIEKSLTKRIMSYWKWERLTGKFTNDYDPINYDNIMVTGYLGVAIGLYSSTTGDRRYEKDGALEFVITDKNHSKQSFGDLADAMYRNMAKNDYCLYPWKPNWTYSLCNGAIPHHLHPTISSMLTTIIKPHRHGRPHHLLPPPRQRLRRKDQTPLRPRPRRRNDGTRRPHPTHPLRTHRPHHPRPLGYPLRLHQRHEPDRLPPPHRRPRLGHHPQRAHPLRPFGNP